MTLDVLTYLIARWRGDDSLAGPDGQTWLTRTDYEPLERWDVLLAQEAYLLGGEEAQKRWSEIYRGLPPDDRVWDVEADGGRLSADESPLAAILYHQWRLAKMDGWGRYPLVTRT
ncbi:MAG: hypothetical protein QGH20_02615 [Candidatus Latescibacteria bacterium]|jgi:hypothetical protein|nr:hypothetical protein [Candidatus Latescibacterota bacterium]